MPRGKKMWFSYGGESGKGACHSSSRNDVCRRGVRGQMSGVWKTAVIG